MKRDEYIFMTCVYALIIGLGFIWPFLQKQMAEHRNHTEDGLNRIIAVENTAVHSMTHSALKEQKPKILMKPKPKGILVQQVPVQKRLVHGSITAVHTDPSLGTSPLDGNKKNTSPETNPLG